MKVVRPFALVLFLLMLAAGGVQAEDAASVWDLVSQGKSDEAVALGRKTLAADPDDVRTARILQDILRAEGKEDEARAIAASCTRPVHRDQLEARLLPAADAMRRLRALKENGDASSSLRLDLAVAYIALDRARNAESELKGHVKAFPADAEAHELLGRARFANGNARTARPALDGMTTDTEGWLYVATRLGVQICDQAGRVNFILPPPTGARHPANICFGGAELDTLYAMCGDRVYKRRLSKHGVRADRPVVPAKPRL